MDDLEHLIDDARQGDRKASYDVEGRSIQEVGAHLNRSPGAVYMLRARAHEQLAGLLGRASAFLTYKG